MRPAIVDSVSIIEVRPIESKGESPADLARFEIRDEDALIWSIAYGPQARTRDEARRMVVRIAGTYSLGKRSPGAKHSFMENDTKEFVLRPEMAVRSNAVGTRNTQSSSRKRLSASRNRERAYSVAVSSRRDMYWKTIRLVDFNIIQYVVYLLPSLLYKYMSAKADTQRCSRGRDVRFRKPSGCPGSHH
ncbi:hypothetical protein [Halalkalicoccus ordinarius]|uniref:hypothetical protein n=1 Tax=Halalkalicoccus ordinarius TaxID=3116651 RepID=UPI00300F602C